MVVADSTVSVPYCCGACLVHRAKVVVCVSGDDRLVSTVPLCRLPLWWLSLKICSSSAHCHANHCHSPLSSLLLCSQPLTTLLLSRLPLWWLPLKIHLGLVTPFELLCLYVLIRLTSPSTHGCLVQVSLRLGGAPRRECWTNSQLIGQVCLQY